MPRIVSRALCGTSGITSSRDDVGASGCCPTADPTAMALADFVPAVSVAGGGMGSLTPGAASLGAGAGAGDCDFEFGAPGVAAGAEVGSFLYTPIPTQLSSIATVPRISSSAPLLRRRRIGARGGPSGTIFMRITSRSADGVPGCRDSIAFATADCGADGSAGASRSDAGSGIADHHRSMPGGQTGNNAANRRWHLAPSPETGPMKCTEAARYP